MVVVLEELIYGDIFSNIKLFSAVFEKNGWREEKMNRNFEFSVSENLVIDIHDDFLSLVILAQPPLPSVLSKLCSFTF